jgi:hypothetical protein
MIGNEKYCKEDEKKPWMLVFALAAAVTGAWSQC